MASGGCSYRLLGGNTSRKGQLNGERIQNAGLVEAGRLGDPHGGYFQDKAEQGRYGPIFPKTPASYGFSILAKIIPGPEEVFYKYAKSIEETIAAQPDALAVLQLHYLRWVLFPIKGETYFMYQGIFEI